MVSKEATVIPGNNLEARRQRWENQLGLVKDWNETEALKAALKLVDLELEACIYSLEAGNFSGLNQYQPDCEYLELLLNSAYTRKKELLVMTLLYLNAQNPDLPTGVARFVQFLTNK